MSTNAADIRARELAEARRALRDADPVLRGLIDAKPDLDFNSWLGAASGGGPL